MTLYYVTSRIRMVVKHTRNVYPLESGCFVMSVEGKETPIEGVDDLLEHMYKHQEPLIVTDEQGEYVNDDKATVESRCVNSIYRHGLEGTLKLPNVKI